MRTREMWFSLRVPGRRTAHVVAAVAVLSAVLACGESTGLGDECPGEDTARLHVVNTTDTPGFQVTVTYAGMTCVKDLPVSTDAGLELAQLVIEAVPGDVIQVRADGAGAATITCQVSQNATRSQSGGSATGKYQLFVNFFAAPAVGLMCDEGFII